MKRLAVVTLAFGEWEVFPEVHEPMKQLAALIGADFHKITKRLHPDWHLYYEKVQIADFLKEYDGVLYLDGDVLVTPNAFKPDIWDLGLFHREEQLMLFDERASSDHYTRSEVQGQYDLLGKRIPEHWDGKHYNTGVMYFPRDYAHVLDDPIVTSISYQDQAWLNWVIAERMIPVSPLNWRFDCMPFVSFDVKPEEAFIVHYGGWGNYLENREALRSLIKGYPWVPRQFRAKRKIATITGQFDQMVVKALSSKRSPPGQRAGRHPGGR